MCQGELCESGHQAGVGRRSTVVARPGSRSATRPKALSRHQLQTCQGVSAYYSAVSLWLTSPGVIWLDSPAQIFEAVSR